MPSHFPIDAASFRHDHDIETDLEPFHGGRLLVIALVLTAAACSAAWLVENDRLGQIIDGMFNDVSARDHPSA